MHLVRVEGRGRRTFAGRGSGERLQLKFAGEGWVVVQSYEEIQFRHGGGGEPGGGRGSVIGAPLD